MIEKTLFADIHIDEGWPSPDDLFSRNAILDELDALKLGQFVGTRHSAGRVDFSYFVADAGAARQTVERVIRKHLPNREFTIDCSEV
jgi:hypothetical protein